MANKKNDELISLVKKATMKNAGIKHKEMYGGIDTCSPCKPGKLDNKIIYPTLYLNSKNAPDLVNYETGDEVLLIVKGKVSSHSLNDDSSGKRESFDIQIMEIGCTKTKDSKEKDYE